MNLALPSAPAASAIERTIARFLPVAATALAANSAKLHARIAAGTTASPPAPAAQPIGMAEVGGRWG